MAQHEAPPVVDVDLEIAVRRIRPTAEDGEDRQSSLAKVKRARQLFSFGSPVAKNADPHGRFLSVSIRKQAIPRPAALVRLAYEVDAPTRPLGFTSAAPPRQLQFGFRFNF